ncbi:probable RNA-binding protein EIF1AD isoform X2 [Emydura macquarii macquarii]|uniref:probable RNA-binding protein EIF1AD isoform X2 n=1 Tax=Emydura macquarii macquarii TaxID=1129001 RepID=UPI00352AD135
MSQATKRKHVVKEVLEDYVVPSPQQQIVRVLGTPGNNLHEVETAEGTRFLVSMPTKFRKNIWIKRGDFLLVDPIEEGEKVKAEINFVLYKDHVRYLKKEGLCRDRKQTVARSSGEEEDSEDDSDLFVNTNRLRCGCTESTDDSEEEEESVTSDQDEEEK